MSAERLSIATVFIAVYNACVADLKDKTVFITGAARRLGKAIALAMAQAGANVAFTYLLSEEESLQTLEQLEDFPRDPWPSDATCVKKKKFSRLSARS